MASVVLVANGPFKDMAEKIDAHDVVIRMGSGYLNRNDDSGYKTTIWGVRGDAVGLKKDEKRPGIDIWNFSIYRGNMGGKHYIYKGYDEVKGSPTLGWMSLRAAMDRYRFPFSIVGYGFLKKGLHHYWGKHMLANNYSTSHPVLNEKAYIEKLVDEGKLEWLR